MEDEDEVYGDVPRLPSKPMIDIRHSMAKLGLIFVSTALSVSWLSYMDVGLRIVLTIMGIVAAHYSIKYYKKKLKEDD